MRFILSLAFVFLLRLSAEACACVPKSPVPEAYESAAAVVKAKVLSMEYISYAASMDPEKEVLVRRNLAGKEHYLRQFDSKVINKVQVAVLKVYKGDSIPDTLTIYTHRTSGSCGFTDFKVGQDFIIYGSNSGNGFNYFNIGGVEGLKQENSFWAYKCSRTTPYTLEEDVLLSEETPYGVKISAGRKD